jgi:Fur family ferric uptake transcriptional regulator
MTEPTRPVGDSPRVLRALGALRRRGERITPARSAVLRVIDAADRSDEHLTAEQVGARVGEFEPSIHRATVYRTLTSLTDAGLLSHVHLGGSGTVYHLIDDTHGIHGIHGIHDSADTDDTHGTDEQVYAAGPASAPGAHTHPHDHAHVQCVSCGKVVDVPPDALDGVARRLETDLGFHLDTAHAALLGRCADCA